MQIKERLLDLLQAARAMEQAFSADLDDPERRKGGSPTDWAPKDLVAHVAHWRLQRVNDTAMVARDENPSDIEEFDAANEVAFHEHRSKTWDEVVRFSADAREALEGAVRARSSDEWPVVSGKSSGGYHHSSLTTMTGNGEQLSVASSRGLEAGGWKLLAAIHKGACA